MAVFIAFSGGLESLALAEYFCRKPEFAHKEICLIYGRVGNVRPSSLEASLVHSAYSKLKEVYPHQRITLHYCDKNYITTARRYSIRGVDQQMRTALMLVDMQVAFDTDMDESIYCAGWIKEDTLDHSFMHGDLPESEYTRIKSLPTTMVTNGLRALAFPKDIMTPLWDKSKKEIYDSLHPALRKVMVMNFVSGSKKINSNKLNEYKESGIPVPDYVGALEMNSDKFINEYGRYFYNRSEWRAELAKIKLEVGNENLLDSSFATDGNIHTEFDVKQSGKIKWDALLMNSWNPKYLLPETIVQFNGKPTLLGDLFTTGKPFAVKVKALMKHTPGVSDVVGRETPDLTIHLPIYFAHTETIPGCWVALHELEKLAWCHANGMTEIICQSYTDKKPEPEKDINDASESKAVAGEMMMMGER